MGLKKAQKYLNDVIKQKDVIPFRRYNQHAGRKAMGKKYNNNGGQCRFPEKSCRFLLDLLQNAESNAEVFFSSTLLVAFQYRRVCTLFLVSFLRANVSFQVQGLDVENLLVSHIQVNRAPKLRRRTYRAHGRINRTFLCVCFTVSSVC